MASSKAMGSVKQLLLNYLGTSLQKDMNYEIAMAMLKNYDEIKNRTCEEVADICFVSKASLSRFCRFIGFSSYREFQEALALDYDMQTEYTKQFKDLLKTDRNQAIASYRDELISNVYSTVNLESLDLVEEVTEIIHNANNIFHFSHHFLWDIGRFFQSKMSLMGKHVLQQMNYESQYEFASNLTKDDLVLITSITGTYPLRYEKIWNLIINSGCKIIVITQNLSSSNWNHADYVLPCGNSNKNDIGKYTALMVVDMIIIHYMSKYCE